MSGTKNIILNASPRAWIYYTAQYESAFVISLRKRLRCKNRRVPWKRGFMLDLTEEKGVCWRHGFSFCDSDVSERLETMNEGM